MPQVRPTHTPVSAGEAADAGRHRERSTDTVAERHTYVEPQRYDDTLEEEAMTGDAVTNLEGLVYREIPKLVTAKEYIRPIMIAFVKTMMTVEEESQADDRARTFAKSCFDDLYEQLFERLEPLDRGVENAIGNAHDAFPSLLPKVFHKYAEICQRTADRCRAAREQAEWEQQQQQERSTGNTSEEFTSLLVRTLENMTQEEPWDNDLRISLQGQLVELLNQSTSTQTI